MFTFHRFFTVMGLVTVFTRKRRFPRPEGRARFPPLSGGKSAAPTRKERRHKSSHGRSCSRDSEGSVWPNPDPPRYRRDEALQGLHALVELLPRAPRLQDQRSVHRHLRRHPADAPAGSPRGRDDGGHQRQENQHPEEEHQRKDTLPADEDGEPPGLPRHCHEGEEDPAREHRHGGSHARPRPPGRRQTRPGARPDVGAHPVLRARLAIGRGRRGQSRR